MAVFDDRLNRVIGVTNQSETAGGINSSHIGLTIFPYERHGNGQPLDSDDYKIAQGFYSDYYETPEAVYISAQERVEELKAAGVTENDPKIQSVWRWAKERSEWITTKIKELQRYDLYGAYSAVHPYAILKLAGGSGKYIDNLIDRANTRKWYEIDNGNNSEDGGYAKNPTTSLIINWGKQDPRRRFPYAFSDFVFCKYWNKIQNNRMITLRRYPAPVTDNAEPANYKPTKADRGRNAEAPVEIKNEPFGPLCTAVTYFGEGTGNVLSDLLKFSVGYEWEEVEGNIWNTTSNQPEEGQIVNSNDSYLSGALSSIAKTLGLLGDLSGKNKLVPADAAGLPPDPYHDGPYENRILGPMNVISKSNKRKRGLTFSQDGLTITFDYVSRPIANVNNKAILLDLLGNIMLMTSSSGTFFGGLHRYRSENPAVYPWRNTGILNNLYQGKLFGKHGAIQATLNSVFNGDNLMFATNFVKDILSGISNMASNFLNTILGRGKEANKETDPGKARERLKGTMGRAIAAKYLKGATIPYITGAKAILTGDPVGDWHLTIGNPLNPIATIGNLIVDSGEITFSDELGPDDFPIGFTAKIKLKHGMGRDRDAAESMFNRGYGRIYSLPDNFKSSADRQTVVDKATFADAAAGNDNGHSQVSNWYGLAPSGRFHISDIGNWRLANQGDLFTNLNQYKLNISDIIPSNELKGEYLATPWSLHQTL